MNVLWLGPYRSKLIEYVVSYGDRVLVATEPIDVESNHVRSAEFIISYGYRYILRPSVLLLFPRKAINLHISLLPWNRGADPNLWSFLEDTPKGVTIHLIDSGLDTGDILVQKEIHHNNEDTLRTSYERLSHAVEKLFIENWLVIREKKLIPVPQVGEGTFHRLDDKKRYQSLLNDGWDTPVKSLIGRAL